MGVRLAETPAEQMADRIIRSQAKLVGDLAYVTANRIPGLSVAKGGVPGIVGNDREVLERLVQEYATMTGQLGLEACHTAALKILRRHPDLSVPSFAGLSSDGATDQRSFLSRFRR